jgi:hypothetical protein
MTDNFASTATIDTLDLVAPNAAHPELVAQAMQFNALLDLDPDNSFLTEGGRYVNTYQTITNSTIRYAKNAARVLKALPRRADVPEDEREEFDAYVNLLRLERAQGEFARVPRVQYRHGHIVWNPSTIGTGFGAHMAMVNAYGDTFADNDGE